MKKFIKIFVLFVLLATVLFGVKVLADTITIENPLSSQDITALVDKIANFLIEVVLPIAILMILYAAFVFITAGGDETKAKKAKQVLTWAIVGIAVLLVSKSAVIIVKDFIPGAPQSTADIVKIFCDFSWWFLELVFAVAVLAILWSAFRYITASGEGKNITAAKQTLIYAVVGIAIALIAFSVIDIVYSFMPGGSGSLGICAAPNNNPASTPIPSSNQKIAHGNGPCYQDSDCVQGREAGCTDPTGNCVHVCIQNVCVGATGDGCVPGDPKFGLCAQDPAQNLNLSCKQDPTDGKYRCLP
jgi:hypothetical protein